MELEGQHKEIKRLKDMIKAGRLENIKENGIYIRKEEDELLCLKKELLNLNEER